MEDITRGSEEIFNEHFSSAESWLNESSERGSVLAATTAQAHATIALAVAVQYLADSYNGWQNIRPE